MTRQKLLRLTGITGIIAAIMAFVADWLLYGGFYSGPEFYKASREIISEIPNTRLMLGGVLGPLEAAVYIAGFWHILLALKPGGKVPAAITFCGLSWSVIIGAGAYHSAFVFKGLLLRAEKGIADPQAAWFRSLMEDSSLYMHVLYNIMFGLGLVATFTFLFLILFRRTLYPKWMVLFIPTLWILALPHMASHAPAPLGGMLVGGSMNLSFLLFFTLSTILLWNRKDDT